MKFIVSTVVRILKSLFRRRRFDSGAGLSIFYRLLFYLTRMSDEMQILSSH